MDIKKIQNFDKGGVFKTYEDTHKQFEQVSFCAPLPFRHLSYENPADCQTGQPGLRFHPSGNYRFRWYFCIQ